ncbi:MAG: hypothetical protein E7376_01690 [Clostridiales bacterium]|nr:hypothetical protein [Clostridiales bacterium]
MEFFTYKPNHIVEFLNGRIEELLESSYRKTTTLTDIDKAEPIVLKSEEIKTLLQELKDYKASVKKDVYRLPYLLEFERFNALKKYYELDDYKLSKVNKALISRNFPIYKEIKAKFVSDRHDNKLQNYNALLYVYAKDDVKLSTTKVYSQRKLQSLINKGKIVAVDFQGEILGYAKDGTPALTFNEPSHYYEQPVLTKDEFSEMFLANTSLATIVVKDINYDEAKKDYEEKFLPTYKKCLNYLVECAKVSALHEAEIRKNYQKQIQKSNDRTKEIEEAKKIVVDTTKGR